MMFDDRVRNPLLECNISRLYDSYHANLSAVLYLDDVTTVTEAYHCRRVQ